MSAAGSPAEREARSAGRPGIWEYFAWPFAHFLLCDWGLTWRGQDGWVSPVWPAAGIALYAVIRLGWPAFPLLAGGKILAALGNGFPLDLAIATGLADPLKAYVAAAVWRVWPAWFGRRMKSMRDLVLAGAATCTALGVAGAGIGGIAMVAVGHRCEGSDLLRWGIGDALGALVVGSVVSQFGALRRQGSGRWWLQLLGIVLVVTGVGALLFSDVSVALRMGFLILPLLFWSSIRLGLAGTTVVNVAFALAVLSFLVRDGGDGLLHVVALLGIGVCGSLVGAAMTEDLHAREAQSRRAAEQWMRAHRDASLQQQQLRGWFDELPDAVLIRESSEAVDGNRAARALQERIGAGDVKALWRTVDAGLAQAPPPVAGAVFCAIEDRAGGLLQLEVRPSSLQWHGRSARLLVIRDCTPQKQAERELRESELQFARIFQLNPDASVIVDANSSAVLEINEGFERLFLHRRDEVLGRSVASLGLWCDLDERRQLLNAVAAFGEVRHLRERMRRKDGVVILVEFSTREIQWVGRRVLVSMLVDITERIRVETELRASEERYRLLLENMHDVVLETDADGRCLYASPNIVRQMGYALDDMGGRLFQDFLHPDDVPLWAGHVARSDDAAILVRARTADDQWRQVECTYRQIRVSGGALRAVVTMHDVTERQRALVERSELEAQLRQSQKLEAIGTLAGGIAHDFNNLLTSIVGFAQLAQFEVGTDAPVQPHLAQIVRASFRARDLVAKILTFSRRSEQRLEPHSLCALVRETASLLQTTIPANVTLQLDLPAEDAPVRCDASQLHQVLLNLCTNALHAMRPDGGILRLELPAAPVEVAADEEGGGLRRGCYRRLAVRDTGCGMPESVSRRIFEPFFTTKPPGEGTGLGLSVVHGIMQAHRGKVVVESEEGRGTTFTLFLPVAAADEAAAEPLAPGLSGWKRGEGEEIVVIDDEAPIVEYLVALLRTLGYAPRGFSVAEEAISHLQLHPHAVAAVICDYSLPRLSGIQVAERCVAAGCRELILISGLITGNEIERARRSGFRKFVGKPIEAAAMAKALHELLRPGRPPAMASGGHRSAAPTETAPSGS